MGGVLELDACSLRSGRSENSFKTASSEPQLNYVPRQVKTKVLSVLSDFLIPFVFIKNVNSLLCRSSRLKTSVIILGMWVRIFKVLTVIFLNYHLPEFSS